MHGNLDIHPSNANSLIRLVVKIRIGLVLFLSFFYSLMLFISTNNGFEGVRVVESSYSRVLAKWPRPKKPTLDESTIIGICEWVLNADIKER